MLKTSGTHEIEISWEPPKGDFTKYILSGEKMNMYNFLRNSIVKVQKTYNSLDIIIQNTSQFLLRSRFHWSQGWTPCSTFKGVKPPQFKSLLNG